MNPKRTIFTVESHTMGEPLRLVVGGMPALKGNSMAEKRQYFIDHYDYIRTALMQEPRGHNDMFGAVLVPPTMPEADVGVFFMHGLGFHNMCGHGTIATNTILVETGLVDVTEPVTTIKMEAPAGLVTVHVNVEDGTARSVSFENVPAFVYRRSVPVEVPGYGLLDIEVAFGGSFFAIIEAAKLGIPICRENAGKLIDAGMAIIEAANEQIEIVHPDLPHIKTIDLCEIFGPPQTPGADLQNITIFDGQIDRSPCGTSTCAELAVLWDQGKMKVGDSFVYESVINTTFTGRILDETKVGPYPAILPEVTGSAYITGYGQYVIDDNDPVKYGFRLNK